MDANKPSLTFNAYQAAAIQTASYPNLGANLVYPALGLVGEAGEAADKIKKFYRNTDGHMAAGQMTDVQRKELAKEVGDVLWYIAALAYELDIDMEEMAAMNIAKLRDRQERGVIKSEGDNR